MALAIPSCMGFTAVWKIGDMPPGGIPTLVRVGCLGSLFDISFGEPDVSDPIHPLPKTTQYGQPQRAIPAPMEAIPNPKPPIHRACSEHSTF